MLDKITINPEWQSSSLETMPVLNGDQVHLWRVPLDITAQQTLECLDWLNETQRAKYAKRRNQQLKSSYIAGRYYLYQLLSSYVQVDPSDINLEYSRLSKPRLRHAGATLRFNFTDTLFSNSNNQTKSVGLFAFSLTSELGVDLEALSRKGNFSDIVARRFTPHEQQFVTDKNGQIDPELFLSIWTRKEASGKATGQGINFKMNQRSLIDDNAAVQSYVDEKQKTWMLHQLRICDSLIGCLVHEGHEALTLKTYTVEDNQNATKP